MSAIGAAAITAGAAIAGSGINSMMVGKANKKSLQLAREQRDYDERMWHLSNEYNSPSQQMERLKSAGLNPALVYGDGAGAAGSSPSSLPQYNAPTVRAPQVPTNIGSEVLASYQNARMTEAQTNNLQSMAGLNDARKIMEGSRVATESLKQAGMGISNARSSLELAKSRELFDTSIDAQKAMLSKAVAETMNIEARTGLYGQQRQINDATIKKMAQDYNLQGMEFEMKRLVMQGVDLENAIKRFEVGLNKSGFSRSDPYAVRAFVSTLGSITPQRVSDDAQYLWKNTNREQKNTIVKKLFKNAPNNSLLNYIL